MYTGAFSPGVNRPGREAHYSPPSTAGVKNAGNYISTSHTSSLRGTYKHKENNILLYLTLRYLNELNGPYN